MVTKRIKIPLSTVQLVLHEAGYRCANPTCRTILTLDLHHLQQVADGGSNAPSNLLALCKNCHGLHHAGVVTPDSIRAWKHLLLALNDGFDRKSVDLLLALHKLGAHWVTGDGVLECAALVASGLVQSRDGRHKTDGSGAHWNNGGPPIYTLSLTEKGERFVEGWEQGDQSAATGQRAF